MNHSSVSRYIYIHYTDLDSIVCGQVRLNFCQFNFSVLDAHLIAGVQL